jgi:hypothetical protein
MTDVLDELRGFCHGKTETVYTRAVAEIERLREATRWRSAAEELPAHGQIVIVGFVFRDAGPDGTCIEVGEAVFDRESGEFTMYSGGCNGPETVTHWMLRPKPPK